MYTAKIRNSRGMLLTLTGQEAIYQVTNIDGLDPPKAQLNTSTIAGLDGAVFNSSKLGTRNIVITVKINGNVEVNRQNLYKYFVTKERCTFFYKNENRDVFADGYVEDVTCGLFTNKETAQISIICPFPYFKSVEESSVSLSNTISLFEFPFSINYGEPVVFSEYERSTTTNVFNASESATGAVIQVEVLTSVGTIEVKNTTTGDDFSVTYTFQRGDVVTINTNKGQKSVKLLRSGVATNLFAYVSEDSRFFQLEPGDNYIGYLVDNGANDQNVIVTVNHYETFRGV